MPLLGIRMNTDKDDALRRLKKLLQFDESNCTPEEFALAGVRIKAILEKYQLSITDVNLGTMSEVVGESVVEINHKNIKGWERFLAYQIATAFECKAFTHPIGATIFHGPVRHALIFIGMKSDIDVCKYFYEVCSRKLIDQGKKEGRRKCYSGASLTSYVNSFMMGAAHILGYRLKRHYVSDNPEQRNALVIVKSRIVDEYVEKLNTGTTRARPEMKVDEGLVDGANAAYRFELHRGIGSQESGDASLLTCVGNNV